MGVTTCPNHLILNRYADDEIDPDRWRSINRHVHACVACTAVVSDIELLGRQIRLARYVTAPADLRASAGHTGVDAGPALDSAFNYAWWHFQDEQRARARVFVVCRDHARTLRATDSTRIRSAFLKLIRSDEDADVAVRTTAPDAHPQTFTLTPFERGLLATTWRLRELVLLRDMESLSYREIAGITGTELERVADELSHAREVILTVAIRVDATS